MYGMPLKRKLRFTRRRCAPNRAGNKRLQHDFVGTPVYWGNMNGKLKSLFDRLVGVLMGESKLGIPIPLHKGKKAVVVTACTTPFPFNYVCGQSSGAFRAVKEILKSSGFKIARKVNISNTKEKEVAR